MEYPRPRNKDLLEPPYNEYFADELAELYSDDLDSPDERRTVELHAILDAALFVAETVGPGAWQAFDAKEFAEACSFLPEQKRGEIAVVLIGFYVWLAAQGAVCRTRAGTIVAAIHASAPRHPMVENLFREAQSTIADVGDALA